MRSFPGNIPCKVPKQQGTASPSLIKKCANTGLVALALLCLPAFAEQTDYERAGERLAKDSRPAKERLHALFKLNWEYTLREFPEFATEVGASGFNDRWTDHSFSAVSRRQREVSVSLAVLNSIAREDLGPEDRLNYDLFRRNVEEDIERTKFPDELLAINQMGGLQQEAAEILDLAPLKSAKDYQDMIARLRALPVAIEQIVVLLKKGLESGVTPPRITLREVPSQVLAQMDPDPRKNALLKPFTEFPLEIPERERVRLRDEAAVALRDAVIPAFGKLHAFLTKQYLPGARDTVGWSALPDGEAWYKFYVRSHTTTALSPAEIHQIGLAQVKRIRAEMSTVIANIGFKGSFDAFMTYLRKNPRFFYRQRNELLIGYRDIAKRIDPELTRFIGKLPRLPYGVLPVPSYSETAQATAYYQPGSPVAGRPGYFFANTYRPETRPKWEMEVLTAHEAVPGHHLQLALAEEMESVPDFRKHAEYTAYVEGWGLYAEGLAEEMGLYKDPYMKFGQLVYDMWRAIRLVVDTGLHVMGWTRQQAIQYFYDNAGKAEHDVTVEVDRYIVWPGQALAYKLGQLKIKELRSYATRELGDRFDVRSFHDQILGSGALPLDILEQQTKAWVDTQKANP